MNCKSKYIPLILSHTNNLYIKKEIKTIRSMFKLSFNLNYHEYFHNYGDYYLKKKILEYIEKKKINLLIIFFHNDNFEISLEFLKEVKKKAKIIFIVKDDGTNMLIHSRYYAILSDAIVTNSLSAHFYYKSLNINSYISGDSRPKIKYYNGEKKLYDVSFIGSFLKGERHKIIDAIIKTKLRYFFLDTSKEKNRITENKYNKIIRQSKINLNFTSAAWPKYKFFSIFDPFINHNYSFKGRIIEIGMNKSFVLSEYDFDTEYFWKKKIPFFFNLNDMIKKINYYLKNNSKRNLIANNLYKKCIKDHVTIKCYNLLLTKILKSLDKKIKNEINQSKINDKQFKNLEAMFLLKYLLKMFVCFKFKAFLFSIKRFCSINLLRIFNAFRLLTIYCLFYYR